MAAVGQGERAGTAGDGQAICLVAVSVGDSKRAVGYRLTPPTRQTGEVRYTISMSADHIRIEQLEATANDVDVGVAALVCVAHNKHDICLR